MTIIVLSIICISFQQTNQNQLTIFSLQMIRNKKENWIEKCRSNFTPFIRVKLEFEHNFQYKIIFQVAILKILNFSALPKTNLLKTFRQIFVMSSHPSINIKVVLWCVKYNIFSFHYSVHTFLSISTRFFPRFRIL